MPTAESRFIAKIRDQIEVLRDTQYAYNRLLVYVCGIAEPWPFGRADEFEFDGDEVLVVRQGPTPKRGNAGVPEFAFPLRHVVATELAVATEPHGSDPNSILKDLILKHQQEGS
jgi:hypothetical protein